MGKPPRFRRRMSDRTFYVLLALAILFGALAGGWMAMLAYKGM